MHELLRVEGLPVLQNRVYASRQAALQAPTGDVVLVQDPVSGLIHNIAFDPDKLHYDADYQNEQAHSGVFSHHLDEVLQVVRAHFADRRILEVGCGKATFLRRLRAAGFDATGIDPAYDGDEPFVLKQAFRPGLGLAAPAVVLRHVLEHMRDPLSFLREIAVSNGGQGLIYIEVPSFDWIVERRAWFDVFYEHVNYFRLGDLKRLFDRVLAAGLLFGGQYQYLVADLASLRDVPQLPFEQAHLPPDFEDGLRRCAGWAADAPQAPRVIWGASSKGVIFAERLRRIGIGFDAAIDVNPAKQGRFLPLSGLAVISPDEALRTLAPETRVFIMNSNYHREIVAQSANRFRYLTIDQGEP